MVMHGKWRKEQLEEGGLRKEFKGEINGVGGQINEYTMAHLT